MVTDGDHRLMILAHHIGGWSKDRGRRVGAVIVGPHGEVRSIGYNGFPDGVMDDIEGRHDAASGEKYLWTCHAEINAICTAARVGVPLSGCKMFVSWFPCVECAKAAIQSGIVEIIAHEPDLDDARWGASHEVASMMLREAGVVVRVVDILAPSD